MIPSIDLKLYRIGAILKDIPPGIQKHHIEQAKTVYAHRPINPH
jgi:hypothetical protein